MQLYCWVLPSRASKDWRYWSLRVWRWFTVPKNQREYWCPCWSAGIFWCDYYKRHVKWIYLIKLLPWMVLGVLWEWFWVRICRKIFLSGMAVIIFISVDDVLLGTKKDRQVPTHWSFAALMGMMAGFTTMVETRRCLSIIYFLAIKLPKNEFIGTAAWLFFIWTICSWFLPHLVMGYYQPGIISNQLEFDPCCDCRFLFGCFSGQKNQQRQIQTIDPPTDRNGRTGDIIAMIIWQRLRLLFRGSRWLLPVQDRSYRLGFWEIWKKVQPTGHRIPFHFQR